MMNNIYEFARKIVSDTNKKDRENMKELYNTFSDDEKKFIDIFMKKCGSYKKDIIFNEKSGCINFCYKDMQIGRIRLGKRTRKMQILTTYDVNWIEDITLEEAIDNIDKWIKYLDMLINNS